MNVRNILLVFFLILGCSVENAQSNGERKDQAYTIPIVTLSGFIAGEFAGEANVRRDSYAAYSPAREKEVKNNEYEGEIIQADWDPIVVVSTYYITGIVVQGETATGRVIFERLAYCARDKDARKVIPEYLEGEEVVYKLIKKGTRWYVYEPPTMRISLAAIIKYYREITISVIQDDFWIDPKFSNEQREGAVIKFNDMRVLMQLATDYLKRLEKRYENLGGPGYPEKERRQRVKGGYNGKWNLEIIPDSK